MMAVMLFYCCCCSGEETLSQTERVEKQRYLRNLIKCTKIAEEEQKWNKTKQLYSASNKSFHIHNRLILSLFNLSKGYTTLLL